MNYSIVLCYFLNSFVSLSQPNNDALLLKKWYFCDTNFFVNENELIVFSVNKDACSIPENFKKGMLELRSNRTYSIENELPCTSQGPKDDGVIDVCITFTEGEFMLDNNIIFLNGNRYHIDALDEQYLLLRREN